MSRWPLPLLVFGILLQCIAFSGSMRSWGRPESPKSITRKIIQPCIVASTVFVNGFVKAAFGSGKIMELLNKQKLLYYYFHPK